MSLAVCMITRGPAGRVASVLQNLRSEVDEIVVAADSAGDPALGALAEGLADRVIQFETPGALEGVLLWALRQCRSDWILRLDDDEIPTPCLLEEARSLCDTDVTHAYVPWRWLWPDRGRWIVSPPLGCDLHVRVLRNLPALWRQGPAPHDPLTVLGPHRVLGAPVYHADLLVRDTATRRAKAAAYEAVAPGHRLEDLPTNALYVPEDFEGLQLADVDPEHRDAVAALFETVGPGPGPGLPRMPPVPSAELLACTSAPDLTGAEAGEVSVPLRPRQLAAGLAHQFVVEAVNRSAVTWPGEHAAGSPIRIGVAWQGHGELPRLMLPAPVPPGAIGRARLTLTAPDVPGRYRLTLRLVHEHVAWFGDEVTLDLEVVAPTGPSPPYRARSASNGT